MNTEIGLVAITGANGQLGSALVREFGPRAIALSRPFFDLERSHECGQQLRQLRPSVVVNCAAYVRVDAAETEREVCELVNTKAVATLAEVCDEIDACLVQISTDYVFDGATRFGIPWQETDEICPVSVYARSKANAEREVARLRRHVIVRTCGLYGRSPKSGNFVETMLRLGRERTRLRVVNDQHCTPTRVDDLTKAICFLLEKGEMGLFHITNQGATTWHDFAAEIFRLAQIPVQLDAISTAEYAAPAKRPAYSVLDTSRYHALNGPRLPPWQAALARYLEACQSSAAN